MRIPAFSSVACGLALLAPVLTASGCSSSRGFCEASADCDAEIFGVAIDAAGSADDDVAVCIANQDGQTAALRANEEEACHDVANARDAYFACVGSEFAGGSNDGCDAVNDDCDNELDDLQDALQEIDGDECSQNET